ncbi:MAG: hypothetical protein J5858_11255 [Lentisphaeria bacterium]|nr:hypothetical protein [Lentisphaeria bacterium]
MFILDYDPGNAARMLCDVHLRKMCLETAQILSSVICLRGKSLTPGMPKPYNLNHPVVQALNTPPKVEWTLYYNASLQQEYRRRFEKEHAYSILVSEYEAVLSSGISIADCTDWSFARDFKGIVIPEPDLVQAYRLYYRYKKRLIRKWKYTRCREPEWLN